MIEQQAEELFFLQTDAVALTIKGVSSSLFSQGKMELPKDASLGIFCTDPWEANLAGAAEQRLFEKRKLGEYRQYVQYPVFFEQQGYELIVESIGEGSLEFWHENEALRHAVSPVRRGSRILSGVLKFEDEIGYSDLVILLDGKEYLRLTVEVFPTRMDYRRDYRAMVEDVSAQVHQLAFDYLKRTYLTAELSTIKDGSSLEFLSILTQIYDRFLAAADAVLEHPHHVLQKEHRVVPAHRAAKTDAASVRWLEKHPQHVLCAESGIQVEKILAVHQTVSFDTRENRIVKQILHLAARRLIQFRRRYSGQGREADENVLGRLDVMIQGLNRRSSTGFLRELHAGSTAGELSVVFAMSPAYRELLRCHLMLQHGLSLSEGIYRISVKSLSVLYSYWSFLKLNQILKQRYRLLSQDLIRIRGGMISVLAAGEEGRVRYLDPNSGESITLTYHPSTFAVPTVSQNPESLLQLRKRGAKVTYSYVFDARYRSNPAPEGSEYRALYGGPGPMEEDINAMHHYRDALVQHSGTDSYQRMLFGAYVLFPGTDGEAYRAHPFYKSISRVNIGGLPFLPSQTVLVEELLDQLIADSPASVYDRTVLPPGIAERLGRVDWSRRDVLIGSFRNRGQFETCLLRRFYYIPAERIKDSDLPIHYIAMFQTPRIFGDDAGIYYYGEILRSALVRRKNIVEVPMHGYTDPEAFYYKYYVRQWIPLDHPIMPRESAFVHAFTNRFLLENVEYVPELLLRSEGEYRLYTELKRRTEEVIIQGEEEPSGFLAGNKRILLQDGVIQIFENGSLRAQCTLQEFQEKPSAVFRRLQK